MHLLPLHTHASRPSKTKTCHVLSNLCMSFTCLLIKFVCPCVSVLLVWFSPKFLEFWKTERCVWAFLLRMENGFVPRAEGPWFLECPYATFRFPFGTFVFRRNRGRNLTFVPRAEGPWFVGAGRRLLYLCFEGRNLTFVPLKVGETLPTTIYFMFTCTPSLSYACS